MPASDSPFPQEPHRTIPFYAGEHLRYQNMNVGVRFGASLAAVPLNVVYWDRYDWLAAGLTAAGTLAFMAPTNPSPDAALQFWIVDNRPAALKYVFPRLTTEIFSTFGLVLIGTGAITGWAGDWPDVVEWSSLMLETLGVAQFWHIAQKLLVGRESPEQGNGYGVVFGPATSSRVARLPVTAPASSPSPISPSTTSTNCGWTYSDTPSMATSASACCTTTSTSSQT